MASFHSILIWDPNPVSFWRIYIFLKQPWKIFYEIDVDEMKRKKQKERKKKKKSTEFSKPPTEDFNNFLKKENPPQLFQALSK